MSIPVICAIVLVVLGNLADYMSTVQALKAGKREMNPLINRFGLEQVKTLGTGVQVGLLFLLPPGVAAGTGFGLFVLYSLIARHNLKKA